MRRLTTLLLLVLAPAPAAADWLDTLELGVGVRGSLGGSYSGSPDILKTTVEGVEVEPVPYEGWWGFGPGGGVNLDARLFGWLGLELGFLITEDEGREDLEYKGYEAKLTARNTSLHVPLAVVFTLPARGLRPLLLLGYEVVVPLSKTVIYDSQFLDVSTEASAYGLLHTGVGFEVDLPVDGYDLRIPFAMRFAINMASDSETLDDRARYSGRRIGPSAVDIDEAVYSTEYDAHITLTTGLTWYFR